MFDHFERHHRVETGCSLQLIEPYVMYGMPSVSRLLGCWCSIHAFDIHSKIAGCVEKKPRSGADFENPRDAPLVQPLRSGLCISPHS